MDDERCSHGNGWDCAECLKLSRRESLDNTCDVCMDSTDFRRIAPCGHDNYCVKCLSQLTRCPMCQTRIDALLPMSAEALRPARPAQVAKRKRQVTLPFVQTKKRRLTDLLATGDVEPGDNLSVRGVDAPRGQLTADGKLVVPDWKGKRKVCTTPADFANEMCRRANIRKTDPQLAIIYHPPKGSKRLPKTLHHLQHHGYK